MRGDDNQCWLTGGERRVFALAFTAALNPKLLAIDLLLIENRRSRAMFLCLLLDGVTVALTIGLLDVLVFPRRCPQTSGHGDRVLPAQSLYGAHRDRLVVHW